MAYPVTISPGTIAFVWTEIVEGLTAVLNTMLKRNIDYQLSAGI
jgi:hypothetical protein